MTDSQLHMIWWYHARTPFYDVPMWVYGLRFATTGQKYMTDFYLPWDYGLTADCQLLCRHHYCRRLPFQFMPELWEKLKGRRQELSQWSTRVA